MGITLEVQSAIKDYEVKNNCPKCDDYKKVLENYKNMIENGLAKPRENNLLPIEKRYEMHYEINK